MQREERGRIATFIRCKQCFICNNKRDRNTAPIKAANLYKIPPVVSRNEIKLSAGSIRTILALMELPRSCLRRCLVSLEMMLIRLFGKIKIGEVAIKLSTSLGRWWKKRIYFLRTCSIWNRANATERLCQWILSITLGDGNWWELWGQLVSKPDTESVKIYYHFFPAGFNDGIWYYKSVYVAVK